MTDDGHRRAKMVFGCAKKLEGDDRAAFLDQACRGDGTLRHEVEDLLVLDTELERAEAVAAHPTTIGAFNVLRRLGEGGMGEVWEAEQRTPVRRRVALKLVKWGMDTRHVLARFEAERQALALMSHPNIAMVYEAGATEEGRPYFAMEYVDGPNLVEYCDDTRLPIAGRLRLFMEVCQGVQHAHHKGVIHRDLKPSNVLVSLENGRPVPKIIDFGVAKAVSLPLTERTLFTETGVWIGTPEYMSPEQAAGSGNDLDTRTDVYSLGVLLYELVAGSPPMDSQELRQAGFDEMRRRIREDTPVKPSTRVSRMGHGSSVAAAKRRTDPPGLMRELRGDLDWIVLRALEKEPSRRYGSPAELAEDLARHLRHEPVVAGPPSALYRVGKYVRRNRTFVASAAVVLLALVAAVVGTSVGMVRAREEAEAARRASHFLESTIIDLSPWSRAGQTASAPEILDRGVERLELEFADQPVERARLLGALGVSYSGLGDHARAKELLEEAAALKLRELGPWHPDLATSLYQLGDVLLELGDDEAAESTHVRAYEIRRKILSPSDPQIAASLERLAITDFLSSDCPGALSWAAELASRLDAGSLLPGDPDVESAIALCGAAAAGCDNLELAGALLSRSQLLQTAFTGPDSYAKARVLLNYATTLDRLLRADEALPYVDRAMEIVANIGMPPTRSRYTIFEIAGAVHLHTGRLDRARQELEVVASAPPEVKASSPDFGMATYSLAAVLSLQGETEEALRRLQESLDLDFAMQESLDDPDFDAVRDDPRYQAFLDEVRRRIEARESPPAAAES